MGMVRACALAEVPEGDSLAVEVDGVAVAIIRNGEDVYAIKDECSHQSIALSEGDVEGCEIECFLHGSRFDLRTGKALGPPATEPVPVYPVAISGGDVLIDLTSRMEEN